MAIKAFILVTVDTPRTREVVDTLQRNPRLSAVHEVLGPYDVIVEVIAQDIDQITRILREEVRPIPGVRNTLTCVAMSA